MSRPETPFIASGVVVVATAIKRDGELSSRAFQGIFATGVLVVLASVLGRSKFAPVVRGIGILVFIATLSLAVKVWGGVTKKEKRTATKAIRKIQVVRPPQNGGGGW